MMWTWRRPSMRSLGRLSKRFASQRCIQWFGTSTCHGEESADCQSTSETQDLENQYLELKQLRDIKSEEFYAQHALQRRYFYYIDLQGRLYLEETRPKNIATSLKSAKFLQFFFGNLRVHDPQDDPPHLHHHHQADEELQVLHEYPFISPCGQEMNFIKCADRPIVFHDLVRHPTANDPEHTSKWLLLYGTTAAFQEHGAINASKSNTNKTPLLSMEFDPQKLKMSRSTHRLYHHVQTKHLCVGHPEAIGLIRSQLAVELSKHLVFDEERDRMEFEWQQKRFPLECID